MMRFPFALPLLLDGATGTNLIAAGMPGGICVEQWILEHPDVLLDLQRKFIAAGSNALYAPTFGANRVKLAGYGLEDKVEEFNMRLVELTRSAARPAGALVGGDISPAGILVEPYGEATFDELCSIYTQQAMALKKAGADFIVVETQMSLADMRAGVLAAKAAGLPVFVTMTVEESGRTVMGTRFLPALITLQAMGADAVGLNCSTGPKIIQELLREALPYALVPLIAKPNAGKPCAEDSTRYDLTPGQFAEEMKTLLEMGVQIVGGCCGTRPEHISALRSIVNSTAPRLPEAVSDQTACAVESECFFLGDDIVLSKPIACSMDLCDDLIELEDEPINTALVEINSMEDAKLLAENAPMARLPIAITTQDGDVLEYALRNFQGRLIVDTNCPIDRGQLETIAGRYGAILY